MRRILSQMKPVYMGVDPAFRHGGFAVCLLDMEKRTAEFKVMDLLEFHDWLRTDAPEFCFVAVENSNMQNQNFDTSGSKEEVARKGRNVGCNQAVSELAYQSAVRRYGAENVFQVSPREKGAKVKDAKVFAAIMRADGITPPKGQISQDKRDAYKLSLIARQKALYAGRFKNVNPCTKQSKTTLTTSPT